MKYITIINKQPFEVEIQPDGTLLVNGQPHEVDFLALSNSLYSMIRDAKSYEMAVEDRGGGQYEILLAGRLYEAQVLDERAMLMLNRKGGLKLHSGELISPMPGLIVDILTTLGQPVAEGQTLVILESMKMQNELKSPRAGIVKSVHVNKGQTVDKGTLLVVVGDTD